MEELFSINHHESTRVFPSKEDQSAKSLVHIDMASRRRLDQVTAQSIQGIGSSTSASGAYALQAHSPHRRGGGKRYWGKFRRLPNPYLRQDPFWGALNWQEQKIAIVNATENVEIFVPEVILSLIFEFMIPSEVTKLHVQCESDEAGTGEEKLSDFRSRGLPGRQVHSFLRTGSLIEKASIKRRRGVVLSTKFGQTMCLPDQESGEWITSEEDWDTKRFKTRLYHFRGWGLRSMFVFIG